MVKLTTTNIVGTSSKDIWSQVQTFTYSDDHQLMLVVKLSSDDPDSLVDLATVGVGIIEEIERKGQGIVSMDQLKILTNKIISEIATGLNLEILVAFLHGSTLYIYGQGSVEAYLVRNEKIAKLGMGLTGELSGDDIVVLATAMFVEVVGLAKFKQILIEESNPAELLTPLVHTQTETSSVAAIVCEVKKVEKAVQWPKINLRNESPRKINLWIGGVIFVLLVMMIGIGMVRRVKQISERDFANLNNSINSKIEETLSIGGLNPERARVLLSEARNEVEAYLVTDIREEYKLKGAKLIESIDKADEQAFKKNDIQLNTVVELGVLVDGLASSKMKSDGKENLAFLDSSEARVVSMNLVDRSRQIIEYKDQDQFADIAVIDQKVFGLLKDGVYREEFKKDNQKKVIESDEFWVEVKEIELFAGNVYILDKGQGEIWKYPTLGDTFGGRRRWFAVGITPDLSNVIDMKVVGDIWILTSTGKLERYSRGAPVKFGMEGFPTTGESNKFNNPAAVWVTDSTVYVLENGANRVVVFGVDGKYQSQYVNSEFAKASDLVVVDNKGYVLIDNVVKEFGL